VAGITLDGVSKIFAGGVRAVDNVSLEIGDGEFMVLVGPSGCGKTTILRMVAGLEEVTEGEIAIGDRVVTDLAPKDRDIAMVFQNYALYPHMTVEQNLGFGLKLRKTPKVEIKRRVDDVAQILGLDPLLKRKPAALSGGQRQRVAMGRAMVREPRAFLMDEPLSNLDAKLRVQMRAELARLRDRLKTTTVYVTHDQVEAMTLGDRVAVMRDGVLQQVDTPQQLFKFPVNLFVAAFIGSPAMNLVDAKVSGGRVEFAGFSLPAPPREGLAAYEGRNVVLGIRPSDFDDASLGRDPDLPTISATASVVEELGSEVHVLFGVDAPPVSSDAVRAAEEADEEGGARLIHDETERSTFTARVSATSSVKVGQPITLTVNHSAMHAFDPATGESIGVKSLATAAG
jgi:multiple sugar transport system ATP-binding protein